MSIETTWEEELGEGYIYLPNHPGPGTPGCVRRSLDVFAFDPNLRGYQIILDVDDQDRIIGIEIVK